MLHDGTDEAVRVTLDAPNIFEREIQRGMQKRLGRTRYCNSIIVTTAYRYTKRKAVALDGPAIVRKRARADATPPRPADEPTPAKLPPLGARKSAIVTIRRKSRFGDAPDLPPDELQRRADAADAL